MGIPRKLWPPMMALFPPALSRLVYVIFEIPSRKDARASEKPYDVYFKERGTGSLKR